jgi:dephospho-CoA kinase
MPRPYLIGLTGNIACGKSTVLREMRRLGAATLDADVVAHKAMQQDSAAYRAIVEAFGKPILKPDGEIDRQKLAAIVFEDAKALERLEAILHPIVLDYTWEWLEQVEEKVAVVDAIKLIESGMADRCDEVWVVTCPQEEQLYRLMVYRGMNREQALTRIWAQPPQEEKVARADVVIDNSGTLEETYAQIRREWQAMQERRQG